MPTSWMAPLTHSFSKRVFVVFFFWWPGSLTAAIARLASTLQWKPLWTESGWHRHIKIMATTCTGGFWHTEVFFTFRRDGFLPRVRQSVHNVNHWETLEATWIQVPTLVFSKCCFASFFFRFGSDYCRPFIQNCVTKKKKMRWNFNGIWQSIARVSSKFDASIHTRASNERLSRRRERGQWALLL